MRVVGSFQVVGSLVKDARCGVGGAGWVEYGTLPVAACFGAWARGITAERQKPRRGAGQLVSGRIRVAVESSSMMPVLSESS